MSGPDIHMSYDIYNDIELRRILFVKCITITKMKAYTDPFRTEPRSRFIRDMVHKRFNYFYPAFSYTDIIFTKKFSVKMQERGRSYTLKIHSISVMTDNYTSITAIVEDVSIGSVDVTLLDRKSIITILRTMDEYSTGGNSVAISPHGSDIPIDFFYI